ncbi:low affinity immunoglobulin gamma Fc region receptor II-like [Agelaius tricolor]|uniref:low affinity immunoglobulin gamma Fc region receptor II-like n=1 Tax=Agelaius tricolor TaxID=9191 RepID=UPI0039F17378
MAGNTGMARKVVLLLWAQTLGLAAAQTTLLLVEPPWRPVMLWDRVTLTCQGLGTAGATTWYKDGQPWGQQGPDHFTFTKSGTCECDRPGTRFSPPVIVLNDGLVLQVPAQALLEGDTVTLRCSVQVGSAPLTFTWLHNGQEVARGPLLELGEIEVGHSGTYRCVATNQLDLHCVFQAPSTELVVAVTLQQRAPPDPPAPPEEGEVLYTHVVVTKRAGASPRATTLQHPQVTNAELRGPQGRSREPSDIYGNVL